MKSEKEIKQRIAAIEEANAAFKKAAEVSAPSGQKAFRQVLWDNELLIECLKWVLREQESICKGCQHLVVENTVDNVTEPPGQYFYCKKGRWKTTDIDEVIVVTCSEFKNQES